MTVCQIENRYWKIQKKLRKKNSTFLSAHLTEGITGCNATQDIAGAFTKTLENLSLEHLPKIKSRTAILSPHQADQ